MIAKSAIALVPKSFYWALWVNESLNWEWNELF